MGFVGAVLDNYTYRPAFENVILIVCSNGLQSIWSKLSYHSVATKLREFLNVFVAIGVKRAFRAESSRMCQVINCWVGIAICVEILVAIAIQQPLCLHTVHSRQELQLDATNIYQLATGAASSLQKNIQF